jgi:hypothetical protein
MMLEANPQNIEWLIEKLYYASRSIEHKHGGSTGPCFVLLTEGRDNRHIIEQRFLHHLFGKYGDEGAQARMKFVADTSTITAFNLPHIKATILLMDI